MQPKLMYNLNSKVNGIIEFQLSEVTNTVKQTQRTDGTILQRHKQTIKYH